MRFVRDVGVWSLVLIAVGVIAPVSRAQPADPSAAPVESEDQRRGRELFENGALLYEEGRYEDAIVAWEAAYDLTQRSGFLFNIANAYERLANYDKAIDVLGRYRAFAKADEREILDRRIRNLEERRAEQAADTPNDRPPPVPVPTDPQPVDSSGPSMRPVIGYSLVGLGAAGLLTGTGFGLRSRAAGNLAAEGCLELESGLLCPDASSEALTANHRSALIADLGFGVGAALAATGFVVLLTGGDHPVSLAPRLRGVEVAMRW